jgi:hypothetical protein
MDLDEVVRTKLMPILCPEDSGLFDFIFMGQSQIEFLISEMELEKLCCA